VTADGAPLAADGAAAARSANDGPILVATGVEKAFGGVTAVSVEHFEVERGSIVALIGPNGAGKTTFFNLLTGFERADRGTWVFEGHDLAGSHAYQIAQRGMVRTFQTARVFPRLTVLDNVRLGAKSQRGERLMSSVLPWRWKAQDEALATRARELAPWAGLGEKVDDLAGTLSGGQRKLLELARSVMSAPTLLMLDEPMAGVNPALRQALLDRISELPGEGITVLFVEHDMDVVSAISDRVVCMAEGRIIASGTASEVAADEAVIDAYLGGSSGDLRDMGDQAVRATPRDVPVGDEAVGEAGVVAAALQADHVESVDDELPTGHLHDVPDGAPAGGTAGERDDASSDDESGGVDSGADDDQGAPS
jgi:branched-chain amino acid transport system ATP-binding protein